MKQINPTVFLVPIGIIIFFLSLHVFLTWYNWRKELRNDEKKKKEVDRLLEILPEDWANYDSPVRVN